MRTVKFISVMQLINPQRYNKKKTLAGFDAPYVPGWDCHGMPIEIQIEKTYGKNLSPVEVMQLSRNYAKQQITKQKTDFVDWSFGDWENAYLTMDSKLNPETRALAEIQKRFYVQRHKTCKLVF